MLRRARKRSRIHLLEEQAVIRLLWACVLFPLTDTQGGEGGEGGLGPQQPELILFDQKKKTKKNHCYGPGKILFLHFIARIEDLQEVQRQEKTEEVTEIQVNFRRCHHSCNQSPVRPSPPFSQLKLSTCRKEGAKHSRASRSLAMKEGGGVGVNGHILAPCRRGQATRAFNPLSPSSFMNFFF